MQDAMIYLSKVGIPAALKKLSVRFGPTAINGAEKFSKSKDRFLQTQPVVQWPPEYGPCALVYVDPDAPTRVGDGSTPGAKGPWLHWLVTDAVGSAASGKEVVSHRGPAPPAGVHRYIFVLFQQGGQPVRVASTDRPSWDFPGFLKANPDLKPLELNFLYTSSE
eukprot:RCo007710